MATTKRKAGEPVARQGRKPAAKGGAQAPAARPASDTRGKLIAAAAQEFNQHGFDGTDSNKIARRAGFAPQTFYRWFRDKTEIFIAVYRAWEDEERRVSSELLTAKAGPRRLFEAAVAHHRNYLRFRRSLRKLALEDAEVRQARAASRLRQIAQIRRWIGPKARPAPEIAALLLQIERLCDALAEGEFADMGLDEEKGYAAVIALKDQLSR